MTVTPAMQPPTLATLRDLELGSGLLGDEPARPLRALGAVLGDLADLRYDAQWICLPASLAGAPHHRFRIFITAHRQDTVPHSAGLRLLSRRRDLGSGASTAGHDRPLSPDHRRRPPRTGWITDQQARLGDNVRPDREHVRRWGRYADATARWEHITGRDAPSPAFLNEHAGPRPAPNFVEWLMGLGIGDPRLRGWLPLGIKALARMTIPRLGPTIR
jgi:DNA (cytosine-5)-methyltransferase 1